MKRMDYTEGCEMLRKVGFTELEIVQISKLRNGYTEQEIYRIPEASLQSKHDGWFKRVGRKILAICRPSAPSENCFWLHDHFLY